MSGHGHDGHWGRETRSDVLCTECYVKPTSRRRLSMRDFSILVSFSPSSPLLPNPPGQFTAMQALWGDIFTQHQGWILAQIDLQWCPIPIGPSKRSHPLLASFIHFAIFEMLKIATFSSLPEYGSTGLRRSDHDISLAVSK